MKKHVTVRGEVQNIQDVFYVVNENTGKEVRMHMDEETKIVGKIKDSDKVRDKSLEQVGDRSLRNRNDAKNRVKMDRCFVTRHDTRERMRVSGHAVHRDAEGCGGAMITVEDQYKHAYQDEFLAQLAELTRAIDAWEERKAERHRDVEASALLCVMDVRLKQLTTMWKLHELSVSTGQDWREARTGIKTALVELEKAIEQLPPL